MSILRVPIQGGLPAYQFTVELDDEFYTFRFRWNARDAHWFMDVEHGNVRSVDGVKVVNSTNLLGQYAEMIADGRVPPGALAVVDVEGGNRDPDPTTFGNTVLMYYTETS